MTVRLPPFKAIEAFVVAGQAGSFTGAASTLHITVPAISRRIQALETELGVRLFHREARRITLTQSGETYLVRLAPALEAIRGASERIRGESRHNSVRLSLPSSFAAAWLIPRLPRFHAQHPDIQIDLRSRAGSVNLDETDLDLSIQWGEGDWPMLRAERLLEAEAFPVCSLAMLARGALRTASDLGSFPLLGVSHAPELWPEWFHAAGIGDPPGPPHIFDRFHLLYQAAASGLGIALAQDVTVEPYLEDDRLVRPLGFSVKLAKSYYLVTRAPAELRRPVARFHKWLIMEAHAWRNAVSRVGERSRMPIPAA
jgi:LysR family glycine cleavage system transcriptional activator